MSDTTENLEGPPLIYCEDCRMEHPASRTVNGRNIALSEGWLIGDDGWYCLRCNAKVGKVGLH